MKIFIKILVLTSFVLTSCSKENEEYYSYNFSENKKLNIETYDESYMKYGNIEQGSNLVFEYEYSAEDDVNVSDDEYSEFIRFEINPTLTEFNYENGELLDIKAVFSKSCFCYFEYDPNKDVPPTGTISGKRISQTEWNISIDVTFYGDEHKNIMNKFRSKN
ncbi:hypothetical protein [Seonamhaeicola sp.]|uniref:hypothetical protein n=1 Tax=Seonamhaeicola sp. TaxID=1912245 RepID=UPI00261B584D|nr:hypothetical protein [Seonamhaeicola sp.]